MKTPLLACVVMRLLASAIVSLMGLAACEDNNKTTASSSPAESASTPPAGAASGLSPARGADAGAARELALRQATGELEALLSAEGGKRLGFSRGFVFSFAIEPGKLAFSAESLPVSPDERESGTQARYRVSLTGGVRVKAKPVNTMRPGLLPKVFAEHEIKRLDTRSGIGIAGNSTPPHRFHPSYDLVDPALCNVIQEDDFPALAPWSSEFLFAEVFPSATIVFSKDREPYCSGFFTGMKPLKPNDAVKLLNGDFKSIASAAAQPALREFEAVVAKTVFRNGSIFICKAGGSAPSPDAAFHWHSNRRQDSTVTVLEFVGSNQMWVSEAEVSQADAINGVVARGVVFLALRGFNHEASVRVQSDDLKISEPVRISEAAPWGKWNVPALTEFTAAFEVAHDGKVKWVTSDPYQLPDDWVTPAAAAKQSPDFDIFAADRQVAASKQPDAPLRHLRIQAADFKKVMDVVGHHEAKLPGEDVRGMDAKVKSLFAQ